MYIHYYNAFEVLHCYYNMQRWKFGAAFVSLCRREASRYSDLQHLALQQAQKQYRIILTFLVSILTSLLLNINTQILFIYVCMFVCFGFKPKFYPWESLDCKFPSRIRFNVISLMFFLPISGISVLNFAMIAASSWQAICLVLQDSLLQKRKCTFKTKNEMQNFLVNRIYHVVEEADFIHGF